MALEQHGILIAPATSTPLAILEIAVNLIKPKIIPRYVVVEVDLPSQTVVDLPADKLPKGWDATSSDPLISRAIGDKWLIEDVSLALRVPSVVVPDQYNVLINPLHSNFNLVTFSDPHPFPFDAKIKQ